MKEGSQYIAVSHYGYLLHYRIIRTYHQAAYNNKRARWMVEYILTWCGTGDTVRRTNDRLKFFDLQLKKYKIA